MDYKNLKEDFFLLSGPCVIESETILMKTAEALKEISCALEFTLIFKSSFKKANRTSINSYCGPGIDEGLRLLEKVKTELELPIITDVHEREEVKAVSQVADIIQIPAFLARQTDLIIAAAESNKIINIKKAQFMSPSDMRAVTEKVLNSNNEKILLTERGTCFGYNNLITDFRSFKTMAKNGFPVVFDVTHSLQQPSISSTTGGTPEFAESLAMAAIATGFVDGLFIETHPDPSTALSDSSTMLPTKTMHSLLSKIVSLYKFLKNN